jgi:hypothetical protein
MVMSLVWRKTDDELTLTLLCVCLLFLQDERRAPVEYIYLQRYVSGCNLAEHISVFFGGGWGGWGGVLSLGWYM